MTLGTAYGTKMPSRTNLASRIMPLSRARAANRDSTSMSGTWTSRNSPIRPTPVRKLGSVSARR